MIGIAISLNVHSEVNCQALYLFNQLIGNAVIGFASVNFALRTMAVWEQRWYIVWPLVVLMLGQWSLLLHGVLLTAQWNPVLGACVIVKTENKILAASFVYTMCFDALVMFLTGYKLATTGGIGRGQRSKLVDMIFSDGLIFFIMAFLANAIATGFMLSDLNPVMSIIFNVPSATVSTVRYSSLHPRPTRAHTPHRSRPRARSAASRTSSPSAPSASARTSPRSPSARRRPRRPRAAHAPPRPARSPCPWTHSRRRRTPSSPSPRSPTSSPRPSARAPATARATRSSEPRSPAHLSIAARPALVPLPLHPRCLPFFSLPHPVHIDSFACRRTLPIARPPFPRNQKEGVLVDSSLISLHLLYIVTSNIFASLKHGRCRGK
jgi:hypothetical protein